MILHHSLTSDNTMSTDLSAEALALQNILAWTTEGNQHNTSEFFLGSVGYQFSNGYAEPRFVSQF